MPNLMLKHSTWTEISTGVICVRDFRFTKKIKLIFYFSFWIVEI